MWPFNILLIIMKKYIFVVSGKRKTPQVVEALEMLKKIYFEQEYLSRIQNHESEFLKTVGFYSTTITVTYLCNIHIL